MLSLHTWWLQPLPRCHNGPRARYSGWRAASSIEFGERGGSGVPGTIHACGKGGDERVAVSRGGADFCGIDFLQKFRAVAAFVLLTFRGVAGGGIQCLLDAAFVDRLDIFGSWEAVAVEVLAVELC